MGSLGDFGIAGHSAGQDALTATYCDGEAHRT